MSKPIVFKGLTIISGDSSKPAGNSFILIENGKISALGKVNDLVLPDNSITCYDLAGCFVLPGLIDTHTHVQMCQGKTEIDAINDPVTVKAIRAGANAEATLRAGFTTIRDLGAENLVDLGVKQACEEKTIKGPHMLVSGFKITPTGSDFPTYPPEINIDGRLVMNGPDEVLKAVRTLLSLGVDVIKIMTSGRTFRKTSSPDAYALNLAEAQAAVDEAHNQGVSVSAHAHGAKGVKIALEAGCDTLEHGTILDEDDIKVMLKKNIALVPTLSYGKRLSELKEQSGLPAYVIEKGISSRNSRLKSFIKAFRAGVQVVMGSDAGMPFVYHGGNAMELEAMVDAGLTADEAIQSTTSKAASVLNLPTKGLLKVGNDADLIIVNENPLVDISVLRKPEVFLVVMKGGDIIKNNISVSS